MIDQMKAYLDALAISFDFPILEFIRTYLKNPFLDKAMPYITLLGEWGAFWIAMALILLLFRKTRKTGWSMGAALFIGLIVCNIILKNLIGRERPFFFYTVERLSGYEFFSSMKNWVPMTQNDILWLVSSDLHKSFPSGHTIACFEACTVLTVYHKRWGIPAIVIAFLVAFSRLYLYVHYPSDVIFSMIAGVLIGLIACGIVSLVYKYRPPKRGKYESVA